ncbi:MAG: 30S ribosomal protein S20 [Minisyncoccales bacterium]|jgi:small subunit ribosomal protein S20
MPLTKSAKKDLRQSAKRKARNFERKRKMKKLVKKVKTLSLSDKINEAKELIPETTKAIDKAAKAGVIKKNTASRKKAGIYKMTTITQK